MCGTDCGCGCGPIAPTSQLGGAYPRTEAVLEHYFASRRVSGLAEFGAFGFLPQIAAVASTVASVVGTAKALDKPNTRTIDPDQLAAAILPDVQAKLRAQGVDLPGSVAMDATRANILDVFGAENRNLVMLGGAGLGVLLLVMLLRR